MTVDGAPSFGSPCPVECPDWCYLPAEPSPGVCMVCSGHGLMWQSHGRPWSACGYCDNPFKALARPIAPAPVQRVLEAFA